MVTFDLLCFRNCFASLGVYLGVRRQRRRVESIQPELERFYKVNGKPDQKEVRAGAAKISMTEKQVCLKT